MEFIYELLFALFFSLLIAKLISIASKETTDTSLSRAQRIVDPAMAIERTCDDEIVHLRVEDEIVESVGGDCDSFESSGTIGVKTEKNGVGEVAVERRCEEEVVHSRVEDEIVESVGGDGDSFEISGTICENIENIKVDEVTVERRLEEVKLEEFDDVDEEIEHSRVEGEIVEKFRGDCDSFESSGTICGNTVSTKVDEVAVERRFTEVKLDEFDGVDEEIEHSRVEGEIVEKFRGDGDSFESSGTICGNTVSTKVDEVAVERRFTEVKLDEFDGVDEEIEHSRVDGEIVEKFRGDCDSFESSGTICGNTVSTGVDEVAVERRFTEVKLEEFDDVEDEIEHSRVEDEIVESVGGDGDSFEISGTICENIGKTVVDDVEVKRCEEVKLEELNDVIVEDAGGVGGSFQSSGVIGENIQKIVVEGEIGMGIGSSSSVNDVAVEERSKMGKLVEQLWTTYDTFGSSGANNDIIESIGDEGDLNHGVTYEVAVEETSDEGKWEEFEGKIVENVGVDNVNSKISGTGLESFENDFDDDDWEGIERSELEESFAAAANYVNCGGDKHVSGPKMDSDVKMELYGLIKVALEGPCREAQPMAIMVSARAKWNAWQRLGNMTPEAAMEQYISLLSEKAPTWMEGKSSGDGSKYSSMVSEASPTDIGTCTETQLPIEERVSELNSPTDEEDFTAGSISVNKI